MLGPVGRNALDSFIKQQSGSLWCRELLLDTRNIQHFIDYFCQALGVLANHAGELALARIMQVFFKQRIGL